MANFEWAVNDVFRKEGEYSDNPADHGGKTRWGITEAVARKHGYDGDMKEFPRERALAIYRSDYWDAVRGDDLPNELGIRMLDFAVNAGPGRAIRALQKALGVTEDGVFGKATLDALLFSKQADVNYVPLIEARVRIEQLRHYRDIVRRDPTQGAFLLGWITRLLT